jgi:hypothetical protein
MRSRELLYRLALLYYCQAGVRLSLIHSLALKVKIGLQGIWHEFHIKVQD